MIERGPERREGKDTVWEFKGHKFYSLPHNCPECGQDDEIVDDNRRITIQREEDR